MERRLFAEQFVVAAEPAPSSSNKVVYDETRGYSVLADGSPAEVTSRQVVYEAERVILV